MSLIQDIILTTMDAWGLLYLVSVEETSKKRKFYFGHYILKPVVDWLNFLS